MQKLHPDMLERYQIETSRPTRITGVQFGADALLLGVVDRLIDDGNRIGDRVGLAVVHPSGRSSLKAQDGLYTVLVRSEGVRREQVVGCLRTIIDSGDECDWPDLYELAGREDVRFAMIHLDEVGAFPMLEGTNERMALLFVEGCLKAGRSVPPMIVVSDAPDAAETMRSRLLEIVRLRGDASGLREAVATMRLFSALAEGLAQRCVGREAEHECARMNYQDDFLHACEPFGRLTIDADPAFVQNDYPFARAAGIVTGDVAAPLHRKTRIFEAGLFALSAPGLLAGKATLSECMKDPSIRDFAGHAMLDEVLPVLPYPVDEARKLLMESFERYDNPMNAFRLEQIAQGLVFHFAAGVLPSVREYARRNGCAPERLTIAFAAAILLLSDARSEGGVYVTVVGDRKVRLAERREVLESFSRLSSDMDAQSLAYAVLSDRELWNGEDLRDIDGLTEALTAALG